VVPVIVPPVVSSGGGSFSSSGSYWAYSLAPTTTNSSSVVPQTNTEAHVSANVLPIHHVFTRTLTIGSTGDDVVALQQILKYYGYYTFKDITGYFGPITKEAEVL
jgi:peptidoglycan hydrolase-like protein with peptidoglycan-binding domain